MKQSDIPARLPIPFANNAGASYIRSIPKDHQAASGSDAPASLYDGFPPECFVPVSGGGVPPNGKDFNGILNVVSAWARWQAAGGPPVYDGTFSALIGGYPKGARVASPTSPGVEWFSTADDNTTDPEGGSPANWLKLSPPEFSTDGSGNWKRVASDGFVEMGGIYNPSLSTEVAFNFTFPFDGFPNACLGISCTTRNTTESNLGQVTFEEVSLSATGARLFLQSHTVPFGDATGGFRWRAWGR